MHRSVPSPNPKPDRGFQEILQAQETRRPTGQQVVAQLSVQLVLQDQQERELQREERALYIRCKRQYQCWKLLAGWAGRCWSTPTRGVSLGHSLGDSERCSLC